MMETKVVIDTSTLMSLYEYCAQNINGDRGFGLLDLDVQDRLLYVAEGAIESLIFYDHPLFDNHLFKNRRWQDFLHDLDLVEGNSLLSISPQTEESLYKKVLDSLKPDNELLKTLARDHQIYAELIPEGHNHSHADKILRNTYTLYEQAQQTFFEKLEGGMYVADNVHFYYRSLIYNLVRYFYYLELQLLQEADLVLHPCRDDLSRRFSRTCDIGRKQFDKFEGLRKEEYEEERKWLGIEDNALLCPMVGAYVLRLCKQPDDIFKVIAEVRNSDEAKSFRQGLSELIDYVKTGNIAQREEVQEQYKEIYKQWTEKLSVGVHTRQRAVKFTVPIPFVKAETNEQVPYYALGHKTANRLLTFIHKMLINGPLN